MLCTAPNTLVGAVIILRKVFLRYNNLENIFLVRKAIFFLAIVSIVSCSKHNKGVEVPNVPVTVPQVPTPIKRVSSYHFIGNNANQSKDTFYLSNNVIMVN